MMFLKYLGFCRSNSKHTSSSQRQYPTVIEELCHQFSLSDVTKSTNNFDKNLILGEGGDCTVYKGCLQYNGTNDYTVAIKRIYANTEKEIKEFKKEIEMLCQLHHPNLMTLIGYCDSTNEKIIVYEYMANGALYYRLSNGINKEPLSWKQRGPLFKSKPKPKSILNENFIGTYGYVAPEVLQNKTVTDKSDVYSFGMVLLEVVCTDKIELVKRQRHPVEENIDPNIKGKIAAECWKVFVDVTERCLKHDPYERPAMGEVEMQLELALSLQEEADNRNTSGDHYTLLSTTIFDPPPEEVSIFAKNKLCACPNPFSLETSMVP
ncbi:Serine-threonine/tyrosine-protein kinase, catalytic domain [Sesbania bispinosa]|nr:Serine-threonine/tyrosine-protein kinase, catalytic domain [Sesbania bispinosa]